MGEFAAKNTGSKDSIQRFGDFTIDSATRELRRSGKPVEIEPKAFDLLLHLIQNPDSAISKESLLTLLWPNSIVTETALTRCVMKARRAVGDSADTQAVIKTVHGHGYRFIGELEAPSAVAGSDASQQPQILAGAAHPVQRQRRWLAAALLMLAVVATGFYWFSERGIRFANARLAVLPVVDQTEDADLAWVSLGVMSLMTRMATEAGLDTSSDGSVLALAQEIPTEFTLSTSTAEMLTRRLGAGLLLRSQLRKRGGLFELTFTLSAEDGERIERVLVGDSPTALAADAIQIVQDRIEQTDRDLVTRFSRVSDDPFVNEAYARALSLELEGQFAAARELFLVAAQQAPDVFWLRYEAFICTRELREWDAAEQEFALLLSEAREAADVDAEVAVLNSAGVMALQRQRYDVAGQRLNEALALIGEGSMHRRRATIHINLALVASNNDLDAESREHLERSLIEFDLAGLDPPPTLLNNLAGVLMRENDLETARDYSLEAVAGFRMRGQRLYEGYALNRLGKILRRQGDLDAALARHEQALAIHDDIDNALGAAVAASAMTSVYRARGDLTRAESNALDTIDRANALDHPGLLADANMQLAQVASLRKRPVLAADFYEKAARLFDTVGEQNGLRAAREGYARQLLEADQPDAGEPVITLLLEQAGDREPAYSNARVLHARWLADTGNFANALASVDELLESGAHNGDARALAFLKVELLLQAGQVAPAVSELEHLEPGEPVSHDELRIRAKVAAANKQQQDAIDLLQQLRALAGEAFNTEDQALLEMLEQ